MVRSGRVWLAALLCVIGAEGRAGSEGAVAVAPTAHVYVAPGAHYHYAAVRVTRPAELIGAIAVRALESRRQGEGVASRSSVAGEAPAGLPPSGWTEASPSALEAMQRGAAPFAAAGPGGSCRCSTVLGDTTRERVAALYVTREFSVGDELEQLESLQLRARYRDGIIVHINGREVARRHIAANADAVDFARTPRGPEWETFHIRVEPGLLRAGANVLAAEVRPSSRDSAPTLDLELSAGTAPRLVRGPMVQRVGSTSATLVFDSDLPAAAVVEYGTSAELGQQARSADGALAVHHVVDLAGLPAGGAVHYRVRVGGDVTETAVFHTAPSTGEPLRVAVYGDVRGGHSTHAEIVRAVLDDAPDLVLVTGDMVLRGSDEGDWQRFFAVTGELLRRVPYYPTIGNHDLGRTGDEQRRANEIFALWPGPDDRPEWGHWYSFDVSGVHFVVLDSNAYGRDEQREWLERDLAAARASGARAIVALTHDGPYSRGIHRGDAVAARDYVPIMRRHGVTVVFSGHDHLYQRGRVDGMSYVVTGGGGAPLYPIRCGTARRSECGGDDGMEHIAREHHYLLLTIYDDYATMCPKRPDGTALEKCARYELR